MGEKLGSGGGGGGVLGLRFAGHVPLASQSPYPIVVYFLANYRPHLGHFLENIIPSDKIVGSLYSANQILGKTKDFFESLRYYLGM